MTAEIFNELINNVAGKVIYSDLARRLLYISILPMLKFMLLKDERVKIFQSIFKKQESFFARPYIFLLPATAVRFRLIFPYAQSTAIPLFFLPAWFFPSVLFSEKVLFKN